MSLERAKRALQAVEAGAARAEQCETIDSTIFQLETAVDAAVDVAREARETWAFPQQYSDKERAEAFRLVEQAFEAIERALESAKQHMFWRSENEQGQTEAQK